MGLNLSESFILNIEEFARTLEGFGDSVPYQQMRIDEMNKIALKVFFNFKAV